MSTSANEAIQVFGVVFIYPGVRALDDVSFEIERRSVTALVGPNGAGKTTLLRCLAGLDRPLTGNISVAGVNVLEEPRLAHARMGHLSDFYGLYDSLTVRQCLIHAASGRGVSPTTLPATVERTAARLGIADRLGQRCSELSRGLRQRVAIGQAIVHSPEVLLLDEPASGLDPEARHALAQLFIGLKDEGMTLVVSSHILAELDQYSTHMLVLRAGRIVEHRSLVAAPIDGRRVRVRLAPSLHHENWLGALASITGVRVIESDVRHALLAIEGGEAEQARVLRDFVSAGLPVASFVEEHENLNESYLRSVRP